KITDGPDYQQFTMAARIWAEITTSNILEFKINVNDCKTGKLISSANLSKFKRHSSGYFLDSIQRSNRNIEHTAGREIAGELQLGLDVGTSSKFAAQGKGGVRYVNNTKYAMNEWDVDHYGCGITGDAWSHRYTASKLDKSGIHRTSFSPGKHYNKWFFEEEMSGFRITIIAHNLEIAFEDLEGFNAKFAKLNKLYRNKQSVIIKNPDPIIQNMDESSEIKRSLVEQD
ncbi:18699_t:CDS:2, partial [Funneliformis geosporum]